MNNVPFAAGGFIDSKSSNTITHEFMLIFIEKLRKLYQPFHCRKSVYPTDLPKNEEKICTDSFKQLLGNKHVTQPRIINVDKSPTFPPALNELQEENNAPPETGLRAVKYLNNSMGNDHKFMKSKSRYRQWCQSFATAKNTLDGMETLRIIQKVQVHYIGKDIVKQNQFVRGLFRLAA